MVKNTWTGAFQDGWATLETSCEERFVFFFTLILNCVLYDLPPLVCACLPPDKSNKKGFSKRNFTGENGVRTHLSPTGHSALLPRLVPEVQLNFFCLPERKKKKKKPLSWVSDSISIYRCVCVNTHQCVCVCVWWEADRKGVCRWRLSSGNTGFRKRKLQTLIFICRCSLMCDNKRGSAETVGWSQVCETAPTLSSSQHSLWSEVSFPFKLRCVSGMFYMWVCVCRYLTSCHTPGGRSLSV